MKKEKFSQERWRRASRQLRIALRKEKEMLELAKEGYSKKEKIELEGRLRINRNRGTYSYFIVRKDTKKRGEIVKKDNIEVAKLYAQQAYDSKMEKSLINELKLIEELEREVTYFKQVEYLQQLHPERRKLLKVLCQEDECYEADWSQKEFTQLNWKIEEKVFITKGGVAVRSKSEKIIGELLEESGLRYRYEARLQIGDKTFYPDFTILSPGTHEEIIWEHFGFMQDEDYRRETYEKIEAYTSAGFLENRFFMTFEEGAHKFNQKLAEQIVARIKRTD